MKHGSTSDQSKPVILALETAGNCGSVALVSTGTCIAEYSLQSGLTHSRRLLVGVEQIMDGAGLTWDDIDGVAVSTGPGSFTGLRIGLSTAKGLIMAAEKPLIGVPTLDGLAAQLPFSRYPVCALLDARKKEVFYAFYRHDGRGTAQLTSDYRALPPDLLAGKINEPTLFIGDGVSVYRDLLRAALGDLALFPPAETCFPRAAAIGMLALRKFAEQEFLDPITAEPIYVRKSDAELHFG